MKNKNKKQTWYEVDVDKIKDFDDMKIVLKHMGLIFTPKDKKAMKELSPFLKGKIDDNSN